MSDLSKLCITSIKWRGNDKRKTNVKEKEILTSVPLLTGKFPVVW